VKFFYLEKEQITYISGTASESKEASSGAVSRIHTRGVNSNGSIQMYHVFS